MNSETSLEEILARPCIGDTSLLCNFVYTGYADLLLELVGEPLFLSPSILDAVEATQPELERQQPTSEFLRPIYLVEQPGYDRYREAVPYIRSFADGVGSLWNPVAPSTDELFLASKLCGKQIWQEVRHRCPSVSRRFMRRGLQQGEAEAVAIAISRSWTVLLEDQAAIELLRCLYPAVGIVRTCSLLEYAAKVGYLSCPEAAELFNHELPEGWGFFVRRRLDKRSERLWLRCAPPLCRWEGQ